jgi:DNA-binding SARP family transcriptional activator
MIFKVLGPVQVHQRHTPRSPVRRAILTALLLRAGHPIGVGDLTEMLWDDPPPSATANIRSHLTGLRRDLEGALPGLSARVETFRGPHSSYGLQVGAGELDVATFTRTAHRGRAQLLGGEAASAADTFEEALAIWRGPFGQDLPSTRWFDAHVAGLNDARIDAYQYLFTASVLAGRIEMLSYRIEAVLAEAPYRQQLWELLAAVHCLDGNAAGALSAVSRCQALYADDLGLELPPSLKALRTAALTWDTERAIRVVIARTAKGAGRAGRAPDGPSAPRRAARAPAVEAT